MESLSIKQETVTVGGRASPLSQIQIDEVFQALLRTHPHAEFKRTFIETVGDRDLATSLRTLDKTDFFTRDLDLLLLDGKIQVAIHSAKDLPEPLPKGLKVIALTSGVDQSDSLVFRFGENLNSLAPKAKIGTSSLKREESVRHLRKDLEFVDIRGTVEDRLRLLQRKELDGLVIAEAALIRLGLNYLNRITLPGASTPLQGQLAIIARDDDQEMATLFSCLDSRKMDKRMLYLGLDPRNDNYPGAITHFPMISIHPRSLQSPEIKIAFEQMSSFTHFIFTSQVTVTLFMHALEAFNFPVRRLQNKLFFAVGPYTANRLAKHHIDSIVPPHHTAEGLLELLDISNLSKAKIFLPQSSQARHVIEDYLKQENVNYVRSQMYDTRAKETPTLPSLEDFDAITFTSPSTVNAFLSSYHKIPYEKEIRTMGPITDLHIKNVG